MDVARDQLKSIVERVERLESEIKALNDDKSDIYKEARSNGFDVKAIKKVVAQRKLDSGERQEVDLVFETYWNAVHGLGLVHAHARENIEEFDPATGEVFDRAVREAEISGGCEPTVVKPMAALGSEESAASNSPETANETVGGFPVAAAPTNAEETGAIPSTRQGAGMERGMDPGVTGGESAAPNPENEAVAPVATALPSAERVTPHRSGSAAANTGGDHVDDTASANPHQAGALVGNHAPAINERCQNVGKCPFSHHPNKITCSMCTKAWESRKVAVPA